MKKINLYGLIILAISSIGCASTDESEQNISAVENHKILNSKQRIYPAHIRNGVRVEPANTWYLGNGESFKPKKPILKVPKEILTSQKVQKSQKLNRVNNKFKTTNATKVEKKQIERLPHKTGQSLVKPHKAPSTVEIINSDSMPSQHNHIFHFLKGTTTLTHASRELLVHIAPKQLVYKKIKITNFYTNDAEMDSAEAKAEVIKAELLRAGVTERHISLEKKKGLVSKTELNSSEKMIVKSFTHPTNGHKDRSFNDSLNELLNGIPTEEIQWVRIISSSVSNKALTEALTFSKEFIKNGVNGERVHILHRQTTSEKIKSIIYINSKDLK